MALYINISPPELKYNEKHVETIVELSASDTMEPLIGRYVLTDQNLLNKTINIELTKGERYYVRARFVFEPGGLQGLSPVYIIVPTDSKDTAVYVYPPKDHPPVPTNEPMDIYPPGFFYTPPIDLPSLDDTVDAVTWMIEDIDGNVVFFNRTGREFLDRVMVDRYIMPDTLYIVKCAVTYKNGNTTLLGSRFIKVGSLTTDEFYISKARYCNLERLELTTNKPPGFKQNRVRLYNITGELVLEFVADDTIILDSELVSEKMIIVSITAETYYDIEYGPIFYFATVKPDPRLPYCIPYELLSD